jgi:hypothetical protein
VPPDEQTLVRALRERGVRYLTAGPRDQAHTGDAGPPDVPPEALLEGLARSPDARLRYTVAPLLLVHPELAPHVRELARRLAPPARDVLVEAYVAAVYLQRAWRTRLRRFFGEQPALPPLWIREVGLPDPEERFGMAGLAALRARQRRGATARRGIYEQAALNLFGQLVAERGARPAASAASAA